MTVQDRYNRRLSAAGHTPPTASTEERTSTEEKWLLKAGLSTGSTGNRTPNSTPPREQWGHRAGENAGHYSVNDLESVLNSSSSSFGTNKSG